MADLDTLATENYQQMLKFSKEEAVKDRKFYVASVLFVRAGNVYHHRQAIDKYMRRYNAISDEHGTERADAILGD